MIKNKTKFYKGMIPWNKGKKGSIAANSGSFKKGERRSPATEFKKGVKPRNWKGGIRNIQGYVYIYSPDHPFASKRHKIIAQHRLVMEKYIGRYLNPGEVIHHIDGNRSNNSIDNLMLFPNQSSHINFRHLNDAGFVCKFCRRNQKEL